MKFSVLFYGNSGASEVALASETKTGSKEGAVSGEWRCTESGLAVLRWSNTHSWLRTNGVRYDVEVVRTEPPPVGGSALRSGPAC